ncbi:MAG: hypothetical protein QG670_2297, partial [Thermoproteota archaeon]|nr:hypothetical protein [Thermoproteota archaeon]
MVRTPGQAKFVRALIRLDADGALDDSILISAASLRILGVRIRTHFIDLLVKKNYYQKKVDDEKFSIRYNLEPIPMSLEGFPVRVGTVEDDLCSFRHLAKPYNIYEEVEFKLAGKTKLIKIRPHNYVRKDCDEAISRMIQGSSEKYWQEMYSYYKQLEAIDLGLNSRELKFGTQKFLEL